MKLAHCLLVCFLTTIVACQKNDGSEGKVVALQLGELKQGLLAPDQGGWVFSFESGMEDHHGEASPSGITIFSDGCIVFQVNGNISTTDTGVYTINADGIISIELVDHDTWPKMMLFSEEGRYFLRLADESKNNDSGGGTGAVRHSDSDYNWTYRLTGAGFDAKEPHFDECPSCGYKAIPDHFPFGACRVCFWRADYEINQVANHDDALDIKSEANFGITLRQARKNFAEIGACDTRVKRLVASKLDRNSYKRIKD